MGISKFIGTKSPVERFEEILKEVKTKEEKRNLEVHLLKPQKLPPAIHEVKYLTDLKKQTVRLVFGKSDDYELFCKHFKVLNYIESNVTDIKKLLALLKALDDNVIMYDEKTGEIT